MVPCRGLTLGFVFLLAFASWTHAGAPAASGPALQKKIQEEIAEGAKRPYDKPDEAQRFFVQKRAPKGEKEISYDRYLAALERMRTMPQYSTRNGAFVPSRAELEKSGRSYLGEAATLGAWTSLGPGNVGGRTRALVIDPRNPSVLYAGAVAGGVWKSTDAGGSWRPLDDLMANLAVVSLAMDPANSNVLYAGTGEGFFSLDAVRGAGIFKTTDGGEHWERLPGTDNPDFYYVSDVVVSARDGSRVYAATSTGVWRSTDGGQSWSQLLDPEVSGGCLDLAIRTDRPDDVLFASCGLFDQGTIYRNLRAQGSEGWTVVLREPGMDRTTLAIAPSNQGILYALASSNDDPGPSFEEDDDYSLGLHAVFRSTRGGDPGSWTAQVRNTDRKKLNRVLLSNPLLAFLRECGLFGFNSFLNQGWYDNVIAVDPKDPNRVWAGGIDLFRSDDGGKTWGAVSYWWADNANTARATYAHADQHVLVFHPGYNGKTNRVLYAGGDGGIFRTGNARAPVAKTVDEVCTPGLGRTTWTSLNHGYGVTQFYNGVAYPDGRTYFGGTQDNGTVRGSDAAGPDGWHEIMGGDGGYVAVEAANLSVLYAETTGLSLSKSFDGGSFWLPATEGIDDESSLFITPFAMDPGNARRLWTGGTRLWRSSDGAVTWTRASTDLTRHDDSILSAIGISPLTGNRVIAGTSEGYLLRSSAALNANNADWPAVRPRQGYVSSVAFDPRNETVAYATYATFGGTHVWKTTDGGATWTGLDGSGSGRLPDVPVHVIVVDPNQSTRLYLGTDLGVFVSVDGGTNWAVENSGFANVVTESLSIQGRNLFAFTHGRGAWRVPLP
ncbi:MAG TPA: hypothetical protein VMW27_16980 [Thermoanaerobaculia bacterium]|nr:hypothetical protein [Thermoanaerobaculia bacterium]